MLIALTALCRAGYTAETEPTHCRKTTIKESVIGEDQRPVLRDREIVAAVRKPERIDDFLSAKGNDFQIIGKYCSGDSDILNYWCIEKRDRVSITKTWTGKLRIRHEKFIGPRKVLLVKAKLDLEESNKIWAVGTAESPGGTRIGTYVVFLRPKEKSCRHNKVPTGQLGLKPPCKSVLVEYFADGDDFAKKHLPIISDAETNVVPAKLDNGVRKCEIPPGPRETSDGEGDHGPDKP